MIRSTRALAAIVLSVWATVSPAQQNISLPAEDARALARAAAVQDRPELARDLAAALLRGDPQDRTALIVLALVEPRLGRPTQGRLAGVRAWRVSENRVQRFEAARLTALAASREGRQSLAQLWLRRAAANAPTDSALDQTARDFAAVRRLNPWNVNLGFSATPSSNVNGGSTSEVLTIDGEPVTLFGLVGSIPEEQQALSGWSYSADLRIARRLSVSQTQRTGLALRLYGRGVVLSDAARSDAPDAEDDDYSSAYAAVTLFHDRAAPGGSYGLNATLGSNWSGGDLSYRFLRLGAQRRWQGDGTGWSVSGYVEDRRTGDGDPDARVYSLSGGGNRALPAGRLTYAATVERTDAPSDNDRNAALRLTSGFALSEPVGPARIALGAGLEARKYPDYVALTPVPGGRDDLRGWATVTASFPEISYAGFAPVITLEASRTRSNVSNFDRSSLSVGFSIQSTF